LRAADSDSANAVEGGYLFPRQLPISQWSQFDAAGYGSPVTGAIYRGDPIPICGVPLGGLDTGCLDLDASGLLGYSSIFNHLSPRGGPLNWPFLGISVSGKTWLLTTGKTKLLGGRPGLGPDLKVDGVELARDIEYWGHYPIADLEYQLDAPISVGLRAWSPFIPGDAAVSNTPGAVFEVHIRNQSEAVQTGTVAFSFPGFRDHDSKVKKPRWLDSSSARDPNWFVESGPPDLPPPEIVRKFVQPYPTGSWVVDPGWNMSYCLATLDENRPRIGAELGTDGAKWANIHNALPEIMEAYDHDGGTTLAVDFEIESGATRTIPFFLAWYAPNWKGNGLPDAGGETYSHMYGTRFPGAVDVARFIARNRDSLLKRVIAWQEAVFTHPGIPGWLADALINHLYYFPESSAWAQAKPPIGYWCKPEDGLFALQDCGRGGAAMETFPNSMTQSLVTNYLFPECMLSNLRTRKAYQWTTTGVPGFLFGGGWDVTHPVRGYQSVLNGPNYMIQLDRYLVIAEARDPAKARAFLEEFYESAKRATEFAFTMRPDYGYSQIVAMAPTGTDVGLYSDPDYVTYPEWFKFAGHDTEWFENMKYHGYASHSGGYRMAHALMMKRWARLMEDTAYVERMDAYLKAGGEALEKYLWTGKYYSVFNEPETGTRDDSFFAPQLNGHYHATAHGLDNVFPESHVASVLDMIKCLGTKLSPSGIPPNYMNPDGSAMEGSAVGGYGSHAYFPCIHYMLGATYLYDGEKEFALDLMKKVVYDWAIRWGQMWDGTNIWYTDVNSLLTEFSGPDYTMNMSIWCLPAALEGQDIGVPCKPGGLIDRMIQAGKAGIEGP